MNDNIMYIDDMPVEIAEEKNLLEIVRKAGIELPVFCYDPELSVYGACRMCIVENDRGGIEAACSTPPRKGMSIYTNTAKLRKHRKMLLELLLANHCRDCTVCEKSGKCKLEQLAQRFGIKNVRFKNTAEKPDVDSSSVSITRDKNKCILCGECVRMCDEIQNVGAIDFISRGSKMSVGAIFDKPVAESNCVGCGQCAAVCPTGAIVVKNDTAEIWKELSDPNTTVVVQVAPAVRVAIGEELGETDGTNVMGKISAALKKMGFDKVFDTSTSADLTVLEESAEFLDRVANGGKLPLYTSCCPGWIRYAENNHPELMDNISSCKSPMQMFAAILREYYKDSEKRVVSIAVMPCTAKKFEAVRDEFKTDGIPDVDYVLTTQELMRMVTNAGITFSEIDPAPVDQPFGIYSGAGVIFGVTGGVTEAVVRHVAGNKSPSFLKNISYMGVRGLEGVKEASIPYGDIEVKIAMVSGLANAEELIRRVQSGEADYHLIEVMACPGGCIAGAGQPISNKKVKEKRAKELYSVDQTCVLKHADDNPVLNELYEGILKGKTHELLHVKYNGEKH